jgi:GNAT superfamily N-acetyltransferase
MAHSPLVSDIMTDTIPQTTHYTIRRAAPAEADLLTGLTRRSKAYWGYDAAFMAKAYSFLVVSAHSIAEYDVFVAEDAEGIAGYYELIPSSDTAKGWLESLFIDPRAIGTGCGRLLWQHLLKAARAHGYCAIEWEADPNAEGFYTRMGAYPIGANESSVVAGRMLPVMRIELES